MLGFGLGLWLGLGLGLGLEDERVYLWAARRLLDLLVGGTVTAVAQVVADGLVKEHHVLRHDTKVRAQRVELHLVASGEW